MKFKGIRKLPPPNGSMRHGVEESGPKIEMPESSYDDAGTSTGRMLRNDSVNPAPDEDVKIGAMKRRMNGR